MRQTIRHGLLVLLLALCGTFAHAQPLTKAPQYKVDPYWPKTLPNNWILGQVAGVATDKNDHIWIIHRPLTITDDEKGATLNPRRSKCCIPAPPVLEFDKKETYYKLGAARGVVMSGQKMSMASISMPMTMSGWAAMHKQTIWS